MAAKIDSSGNSSSYVAEINVIPFVDIVLVVLIIFMVTAPAIVNPELDVQLPKATTGEVDRTQNIILTMAIDGSLAINGKLIKKDKVEPLLASLVKKQKDLRAVIAADKDVAHGRVIGLIDLVKKMGVKKFAVTVDQD